MKTYKREKNRKKTRIKSDILSSSRILREDIFDLISQCQTADEAISEVRDFFSKSDTDGLESFKTHGKLKSVERIISDINSYKTWPTI